MRKRQEGKKFLQAGRAKTEKTEMKPVKNLGIYMHIPFCVKKCFYCDFYSEPSSDYEDHRRYVRALLKEILFYEKHLDRDYQVDTIFIGGGTPSILDPNLIREILKTLRGHFSVSSGAEITLEANPATLNEEKLAIYRETGINRLSIGAQSFDDRLLLTLGRAHDSQAIGDTVEAARKAGFQNVNLDLMFGIPDQKMEMWKETIETMLEIRPEHVSFYSLELSENTFFYDLYRRGKLQETPEEQDREMYHFLLHVLRHAGYAQYEISNGSLPGYACRHNLKYWDLQEYLGLGASAHSYVNHIRFSNVPDIRKYIYAMERQDVAGQTNLGNFGGKSRQALQKADCVNSCHQNSYMEDVTDYIFTALRRTEGINLRRFEKRFQNPFWELFGQQRKEIRKFAAEGYVEDNGLSLRITEKGFDITNRVIEVFL